MGFVDFQDGRFVYILVIALWMSCLISYPLLPRSIQRKRQFRLICLLPMLALGVTAIFYSLRIPHGLTVYSSSSSQFGRGSAPEKTRSNLEGAIDFTGKGPSSTIWKGYMYLPEPFSSITVDSPLTSSFIFDDILIESSASEIDIGTIEGRMSLGQGWSFDEEVEADGHLRTFSWSSGKYSDVYLGVTEMKEHLLNFHGIQFEYPESPKQEVSIFVNGVFVDKIALKHGWIWEEYTTRIPEAVVRENGPGVIWIRFSYSDVVRPADVVKASPDTREIAVAFDSIQIAPINHNASLFPSQQVAFNEGVHRIKVKAFSDDEKTSFKLSGILQTGTEHVPIPDNWLFPEDTVSSRIPQFVFWDHYFLRVEILGQLILTFWLGTVFIYYILVPQLRRVWHPYLLPWSRERKAPLSLLLLCASGFFLARFTLQPESFVAVSFLCGIIVSFIFLFYLPNCGKNILFLLIITTTIGACLRGFMVQYHDLNVDEILYFFHANSYPESLLNWFKHVLNSDHRTTALAYLLSIRWLFQLFQSSTLAIRLLSVILGSLSIIISFVIWQKAGSRPGKNFEALLAAGIISVLSYHLCWSRDGHSQVQMTFFYFLYIYVSSAIFSRSLHFSSIFWRSSLALFLGYWFHGSMLVAPICIAAFAFLDWFLSTLPLVEWKPFQGTRYLPVAIGSGIFGVYVYYALVIQGGFKDAGAYSQTEFGNSAHRFSALIEFFFARIELLERHADLSWLKTYGFSNGLIVFMGILVLLGGFDVVRKRHKVELFIIIQPMLFCLGIASLWDTSNFERFLLPIVLPMACLIARGVNVLSLLPVMRIHHKLFQAVVGFSLFALFLSNSVQGIFLEEPQREKISSFIYRVYSGRPSSLLSLVNYIKQSEDAYDIVFADEWRLPHYRNVFKLPIRHQISGQLLNTLHLANSLPAFVLINRLQHQDSLLLEALESNYNLVGTTLSESISLYELRERQEDFSHSFNDVERVETLLQLRQKYNFLTKEQVVSLVRGTNIVHPDDLSSYGLAGRHVKKAIQHIYRLKESIEEKFIIDVSTGLMWQTSERRSSWKEAREYMDKLNSESYGGYSDWRLPTVEELASLLEPVPNKRHLYIHDMFGAGALWIWTGDRVRGLPRSSWMVNFQHGSISYRYQTSPLYARAVRNHI